MAYTTTVHILICSVNFSQENLLAILTYESIQPLYHDDKNKRKCLADAVAGSL
jgi:hypothetical protein